MLLVTFEIYKSVGYRRAEEYTVSKRRVLTGSVVVIVVVV